MRAVNYQKITIVKSNTVAANKRNSGGGGGGIFQYYFQVALSFKSSLGYSMTF